MDTQTQGSNGIKPIEIFRPGSFTAMNGTKYSFTAAQVQELADTYRPDFADAPLVVGHPKLTSPRFGRAERLFVNAAGVLCAETAEVVPEFAEAVNNKHYTRVSASIYLPDAPGNPTPGKHYLRHIGFLGGAAPAVKGLKAVEFSEAEAGVADFAYEDRVIVRMLRRLRDWFVENHGMETANNIIPDYQLDDLTQIEAESTATQPAFSQPNPQPTEVELNTQQNAQAAAELAQRETDLASREARIAEMEAKLSKAGHAEFAAALCERGQLLPAEQDTVVQILVQLDGINQVADFAEGDPNHGKTGAALFKEFLEKQPKQVEFGRISAAAGSGAGATGTADFAAPMGYDVDPGGLEVMQKAQAYQKDHPGTGFIDAVKAVS
jgi:hypothetical protein